MKSFCVATMLLVGMLTAEVEAGEWAAVGDTVQIVGITSETTHESFGVRTVAYGITPPSYQSTQVSSIVHTYTDSAVDTPYPGFTTYTYARGTHIVYGDYSVVYGVREFYLNGNWTPQNSVGYSLQ